MATKVKKPPQRGNVKNFSPNHKIGPFNKGAVPQDWKVEDFVFIFPLAPSYNLKLDIMDALIDAEIERSIEGASTLTLTLSDPNQALLLSGIMDKDKNGKLETVEVQVNDNWYRMVSISLDGGAAGTVTLQFEDRDIAHLRRFTKYRHWKRTKKFTRAMAIKAMANEAGIRTFIPELTTKQPIAGSDEQVGTTRTHSDKNSSDRRSAPRRQSGGRSSKPQSVATISEICKAKGIPPALAVAVCIIETGLGANMHRPGVCYHGWFQICITGSRYANPGPYTMDQLYNLHWATHAFCNTAIRDARNEPSLRNNWNAWAMRIQGVNCGNNPGFCGTDWQNALNEAKRLVDKHGGGGGGGSSGGGSTTVTTTRREPYEFHRGEQGGPKESSWDAMKRMADEVGWRVFMVKDTLVFMAEDDPTTANEKGSFQVETDLLKGAIYTTIDGPTDELLLGYSGEIDVNKKESEFTFSVLADRWAFTPGMVVRLQGFSAIYNGRWLVANTRRNLFNPATEVTLKRASKSKLEPANTTTTSSRTFEDQHNENQSMSDGKLHAPWTGGPYAVTGVFGESRPGHIHAGTDVSVPNGTACIAPFDGKITYASTSGFGDVGGMIHLQATQNVGTNVKKGDKIGWGHIEGVSRPSGNVTAGTRIATSGWHHVHFVLIRQGQGGNGVDGNTNAAPFLSRVNGI